MTEGRYGEVECFIIPKISPKTSQVVTIPIKPLCLHQRLFSAQDQQNDAGPVNSLTITGPFSLAQAHGWIGLSMQDVPEKIHEDDFAYTFRSTFIGSTISIKCRKGELTIQSSNVSALSVLQEIIAKNATEQKVKIQISFTISEESFGYILNLIYPLLSYQRSLTEKVTLIEALKELQLQEDSIEFLEEKYKVILANAKQYQTDITHQKERLQFIHGIIVKLLEDKFKFKQQNPINKLVELNKLLQQPDLSLATLTAFFGN